MGSQGSVSFGGLMSGLDTQGLVNQLISASSRPMMLMQKEQISLGTQKNAIKDLTATIDALYSSAKTLTLATTFSAYKTTSSDSAIIQSSISSSTNVQTGSITIDNIQSTATFQRQVFSGTPAIQNPDTALGYANGTNLTIYSYTSGISNVSIQVDATTSLNSLALAINNAAGNELVTANVINVSGDVANPDYKLIVKAKNTGLSNWVVEGTPPTRGFNADTLNDTGLLDEPVSNQNGTDAVLNVDGVTVTRSTNTFANVLNGLTFELKDDPGPATSIVVSAERDLASISSKITDLVNKYNTFITKTGAHYKYDETKKSLGILGGDNSFKRIMKDIQSMFTGNATGLRPGYSVVSGFADIGFESDQKTGEITFNSSTFIDKFTKYEDEVTAMFLASSSVKGVATVGITERLRAYTYNLTNSFNDPVFAKTHPSILDSKVQAIDKQVSMLDERILAEGKHLDALREKLTTQFNAMEMLINGLQAQGNALTSFFSNFNKK